MLTSLVKIMTNPNSSRQSLGNVLTLGCCICFWSLMLLHGYPQNTPDRSRAIDSLEKVIEQFRVPFQGDSLAHAYYQLGKTQVQAWKIEDAVHSLELAISIKPKKALLFQIYLELGRCRDLQSEYVEGIKYCRKAQELQESVPIKLRIKNISELGRLYTGISAYEEALTHFYEVVYLSKKIEDEQLLLLGYLGLMRTEWYLKNYSDALNYAFEALDLAKKNGSKRNIFVATSGIASCYVDMQEFPKALYFAEEALEIAKSQEADHVLGVTFTEAQLARIYHGQKKLELSREYFLRSLKEMEQIGHPLTLADHLKFYGDLLLDMKDHQAAVDTFNLALSIAKEISYKEIEKDIYGKLAQYYEEIDQVEKANEYYEMYISLQDSLLNAQLEDRIKLLEKNQTVKEQEWNREELEKKDEQVRFIIVIVLIILTLVVILSVLRITFFHSDDREKSMFKRIGKDVGTNPQEMLSENDDPTPMSGYVDLDHRNDAEIERLENNANGVLTDHPGINQEHQAFFKFAQILAKSFSTHLPEDFSSIIHSAFDMLPQNVKKEIKSVRVGGVPKVKANSTKLIYTFNYFFQYLGEAYNAYSLNIEISSLGKNHSDHLLNVEVLLSKGLGSTGTDISEIQKEIRHVPSENISLFFATKVAENIKGKLDLVSESDDKVLYHMSFPRNIFSEGDMLDVDGNLL